MKYVVYLLAMVPLYQLSSIGQAIDPYDTALYLTGLWGTIWFSIALLLGPIGRKYKLRDPILMRQPLGLAVFSWFFLHFFFYLGLNSSNFSTAVADIFSKPFLTVGFVSLIILSLMALTSTKLTTRWAGKWWKPLHELVVISAALGAAHGLAGQKTTATEGATVALILLSAVIIRYGVRK